MDPIYLGILLPILLLSIVISAIIYASPQDDRLILKKQFNRTARFVLKAARMICFGPPDPIISKESAFLTATKWYLENGGKVPVTINVKLVWDHYEIKTDKEGPYRPIIYISSQTGEITENTTRRHR